MLLIVRKGVVLKALLWLKCNNPNYFDLTIDYDSLSLLPENGNVFNQLKMIDSSTPNIPLSDTEDEDPNDINDISESDCESNYVISLTYYDVPEIAESSIKKSLNNVLVWPSIGKTPVNEIFLSMAVPYLFSYGAGDFSMTRKHKVFLKDYIRHLMLYRDQRFAQDERFRYFIMNSEMRWSALNIGNIYVQKNSFFSKMPVIQLNDFLKKNPSLVNQVMHYCSRMRTTKSYWNSRRGESLDMVNQLGTPTVFFTLSSADFHWPHLYQLNDLNDDVIEAARATLLKFVTESRRLFGIEFISYNVHNLIHLADSCKLFGKLDNFSSFPFENELHVLKQAIRGKTRPLQQLVGRDTERSRELLLEPRSVAKPNGVVTTCQHKKGPTLSLSLKGTFSSKAFYNNRPISLLPGNNVVTPKTNNVVVIQNFISTSNGVFIIGTEFKKYRELYKTEYVSSSDLGI
ncbi:hypothetical protein FOCC_FOCC013426, partial [Frankliniella occidentalis]